MRRFLIVAHRSDWRAERTRPIGGTLNETCHETPSHALSSKEICHQMRPIKGPYKKRIERPLKTLQRTLQRDTFARHECVLLTRQTTIKLVLVEIRPVKEPSKRPQNRPVKKTPSLTRQLTHLFSQLLQETTTKISKLKAKIETRPKYCSHLVPPPPSPPDYH